jgi:hypothetical protein
VVDWEMGLNGLRVGGLTDVGEPVFPKIEACPRRILELGPHETVFIKKSEDLCLHFHNMDKFWSDGLYTRPSIAVIHLKSIVSETLQFATLFCPF